MASEMSEEKRIIEIKVENNNSGWFMFVDVHIPLQR